MIQILKIYKHKYNECNIEYYIYIYMYILGKNILIK